MPWRLTRAVALPCAAVVLALLACSQLASQPTTEAPISEAPTEPSNTVGPTSAIKPVTFDPPAAGQRMLWTDSSTVVYVPGGSFVMGQDEKDPSDHSPAHTLTLNPFWIYQAEVTNRMYRTCVELGACTAPAQSLWYTDPKFENAPVSAVDWNQAKKYCEWMNGRLPTEAEWELAARGTDARPYPWGKDEPSCDLLNFLDCLVPSVPDAVRSYPLGASPYKVADMAGNVSEWVSDWYAQAYYSGSPTSNPPGPADGKKRVVRGSSYLSPVEEARIVLRSSQNPLQSQPTVGFRCVVNADTLNSQPPMCSMLSYAPTWDPMGPMQEASPAAAQATDLHAICGYYPDQSLWINAFIAFDHHVHDVFETHRLDITSPQGALTCTDESEPSFELRCDGDALQMGHSVTITFCVKPEEQPPQEPVCPNSYEYNHTTSLCEYKPAPSGGQCSGGTVVEGYGCLYPPQDGVCPAGYYSASYNGSPVCVPAGGPPSPDPSHPLAACPEGLVLNEADVCCEYPRNISPVCPTGYVLSAEQGMCLPDASPSCSTVSGMVPVCEPTPEVPPPQQTNCSGFGNQAACQAAGCKWVGGMAGPGVCK